jgi:hypothetical protein
MFWIGLLRLIIKRHMSFLPNHIGRNLNEKDRL